MITSALSLKGVTKHFRTTVAVEDVSFEVESGSFVALLGPSGSGKTTLLRLLAGFDLPSSGDLLIDGRNVSRLSPADRSIGMVFQHYALFPHMSVRRNVEYGLKMRGWKRADRKHRCQELLSAVQMDHLIDRHPRQLSGGQQQRVAIARALASSPSLLLMDEPLGALDRNLRVGMAEEIRRIHRTLRTTFLYVTHDRDEAMTLADRVLIMNKGRLVADGTPEALYVSPPSAFAARFFSSMNVLPAAAILSAGPGTDREIGIAPRAFRLEEPAEPHVKLEGRVVDRLFLGDKWHLFFRPDAFPQDLTVHIDAEAPGQLVGVDRLTLYVRLAAVHAL